MGLGRSLYFSGLSSVLSFAIQFALSVFVARMLTPEELGMFGVALAASALVRAFESAGINNFVASYEKLDDSMMRSVFTINFLLNIALGLVLWLLAAPLGQFFGSGKVGDILLVTAAATALNTHKPIIQGLLRRRMNFQGLMMFDFSQVVIGGIATIAAIAMGYGPLALALALVAEKLGAILVGIIQFRKDIPMAPHMAQGGTILRYGLSLSTATVIGIVGAHANNFILGKILGLAPSAQFDRALTLPRLIWSVALPSFHNVLVPGVAKERDDPEGRHRVMQNTLLIFTMLIWPAGLVLTLVSPDMLVTLYGDQWWEAADIAPYFVIYSTIMSPITLACSGLVAFGHGGAMVRIQLAEQGTKILVLFSAFFFGLPVLAALMALPALAYLFTATGALIKHDLIELRQLLAISLRPIRLSIVAATPSIISRYWLAEGTYFTLEELLVLAAITGVVFVVGLKLLEPVIFERALGVIGIGKKPANFSEETL